MPRPREFDRDQALNNALQAFWSRGFEATSMAHLSNVMGMQKGSIYQAFDDKHSLFLEALGRYMDNAYAQFKQLLREPKSATEALRHFVTEAFPEIVHDTPSAMGCFVTNTSVELGAHDAEVRQMLLQQKARLERLVSEIIDRAQSEGGVRTDLTADQIAQQFSIMMDGVMADSRPTQSAERTAQLTNGWFNLIAR